MNFFVRIYFHLLNVLLLEFLALALTLQLLQTFELIWLVTFTKILFYVEISSDRFFLSEHFFKLLNWRNVGHRLLVAFFTLLGDIFFTSGSLGGCDIFFSPEPFKIYLGVVLEEQFNHVVVLFQILFVNFEYGCG